MTRIKFANGAIIDGKGKVDNPIRGLAGRMWFMNNDELIMIRDKEEKLEMTTIYDIDELQKEVKRLRETLEEIRDLARTGVAPDLFNFTDREWKTHQVNKIAWMANEALKEQLSF